MQPIPLAILIVKVALCTLSLLAGLRLVFLSKETFTAFAGRLFGIADLEVSPSTFAAVKVIGTLLILIAVALVYLFFFPSRPEDETAALCNILHSLIA